MIQTIRVKTVIGPDLLGAGLLTDIHRLLGNNSIVRVETAKIYRLEAVTKRKAIFLAEKLFCEQINQVYSLNRSVLRKPNYLIEIAYQPGVMNPEVASIIKSAKDLGISVEAADSSHEYGLYGTLTNTDVKTIAQKLKLFNPIIEYIVEKEPKTLVIKGKVGPIQSIPIRTVSDDQLLALSKDTLFLNIEEMRAIQSHFKKLRRDPTDCELETLAQTWSEHCAHKTFKANLIVNGKKKKPLFTRLKNEAHKHKKHIVSAFVDNSGVMDFYEGWAICGKAETHNSPSAIEPYGGAMTGSGGVFRDVVGTGQGAKAIASTDIFCLATPSMHKSLLPKGSLAPDYMLKKVVAAVRDYGNRVGIPTNNGSLHFHDDFRVKPTVLVGSYGILPKKRARKGKPLKGDLIIVVGGRTGRDGIHGATFSSAAMSERTITVNSSAVQIGNAIEEKRMFDAILQARDLGLIRAIQDLGAGGFSSAIGEMGEKTGVLVDLKQVKLKYEGLAPWEIWVSESQERMLTAIPKSKKKSFLSLCKKYNVEASVLGAFTNTKKLRVLYGKRVVADLSMHLLHHGLPQKTLRAEKEKKNEAIQVNSHIKAPSSPLDWIKTLEAILSNWNICSKEQIVRLYDHSVQGTNVLQPYCGERMDGPTDAAVIRPLLGNPYGVVISHGINPNLTTLDPYWGSLWAATEAVSNYVSVGGDMKDATLINNYIWPIPNPYTLFTLDQCVDSVVDFMKTLGVPVISGKDSLSATYRGSDGKTLNAPLTLCLSVFGKIPDVTKTATSDFKKDSSLIVFVGKQDTAAMAGSAYAHARRVVAHNVAKVDLKGLPKVLQHITLGIQSGKILSCHDVSEGGILTSLFEMCVGGNVGANISIPKQERVDFFLFNETSGTFLVEVADEALAKQLFATVPFMVIGKTQKEKTITVKEAKKLLFCANLDSLRQVWKKPMREYFA